MEKKKIIALIEQRIESEYQKYKDSSHVDFKKTASIKIYGSLADLKILNSEPEK
jgi:hypothetical protein